MWARCGLLVLALGTLGVAADPPEDLVDPEERLLKKLGFPTDTASLLAFLQERSPADDDLVNLTGLLEELQSPRFATREAAQRRLVALDLPALEPLRGLAKHADRDLRARAQAAVTVIEKRYVWNRPLLSVHLLEKRRVREAVPTLLRYLPYVTNDATLEEAIYYALDKLALVRGTPDPVLAGYLTDKLPARRAVAGCLLGRVGTPEQQATVRGLLTDTDPLMRLRCAQGLLAANDRAALPALAGLLLDAPLMLAWQAEELLRWAAVTDPPAVFVNRGTPETRAAAKRAWDEWLAVHPGPPDTDKARAKRPIGLLLLAETPERDGKGRVALLGADGSVRWELTGLDSPSYARFRSDGTVPIAEGDKLVRRSLEGKFEVAKSLAAKANWGFWEYSQSAESLHSAYEATW